MASQEDVRRICSRLPETIEGTDRFAFAVLNKGKEKGLAWVWMERHGPKKARTARPDVVAVRVNGEEEKQALISTMPSVFFTEPHYNGFPAVLVRLPAIEVEQLEDLLVRAWRIQAPRPLVRKFDAARA
ncbi:MAG: MmcQ/YjbR family DNA-binding protein [Dehalococcoidia bacterium]